MGMFDHVILLGEILECPHGHPLSGFQTKSFEDPSMATYLFDGARIYRVGRESLADLPESAGEWRLEGTVAVFQRRHPVDVVPSPPEVLFYTSCAACVPVLVRSEGRHVWGDLVDERRLWVEFGATFKNGERHLVRLSGTRDDLIAELREEGLRVLRDDEPLAIAHHEITTARQRRVPSRRARR